jgi:hypothetical protein
VVQVYSQIQKAAAVQGFDDCFFVAAIACFFAILPTLLIQKASTGEHSEPIEI